MPYYLYKVFEGPVRRLEMIESQDSFRAASARAKALRRDLAVTEGCLVRTVFADNALRAEDLLSQVRPARPEPGDD